jgi:hypothetical protein
MLLCRLQCGEVLVLRMTLFLSGTADWWRLGGVESDCIEGKSE